LKYVSKKTHGYVTSDLENICLKVALDYINLNEENANLIDEKVIIQILLFLIFYFILFYFLIININFFMNIIKHYNNINKRNGKHYLIKQ